MKLVSLASSIVILCGLLVLTGCDSLGLRNYFAQDQVPADVKAQPRLVESAPPDTKDQPWPLVGAVPFKPHNFSPAIVYNHYYNELEFSRAEADQTLVESHVEDEEIAPALSYETDAHSTSNIKGQTQPLMPPQLPQSPKE